MLIENIETSLNLLKLSHSAVDANNLKKDLDTLYDKLKSSSYSVKQFMESYRETESILNVDISNKRKVVNTLERFKADALEGKKDLALQDLRTLQDDINDGNDVLRKIWGDYRSENYLPSFNLIVALGNVIDDPRLEELALLRNKIEENSIGNKETISNIGKYQKITNELIKSKNMDPEIQEFIIKLAAGEKLYLSDIPKKVMDWIKQYRLDKKIQINFAGYGG